MSEEQQQQNYQLVPYIGAIHHKLGEHIASISRTSRGRVSLTIMDDLSRQDAEGEMVTLSQQEIEELRAFLDEHLHLKEEPLSELLQEDYTTWPVRKFRRLIEQYRESAHMAPTQDAYLLYKKMLEPMEEAFKRLHPRAYKHWEHEFLESFK